MNQEKSELQAKEQFRVVINREANDALEAFVLDVNSGGDSTQISKSDLANYIFMNLKDLINSGSIDEIRALYFDAKKALEGILKGATKGKDLPENLRDAILKHCGIKSPMRERRTKKLSTEVVDNSDSK